MDAAKLVEIKHSEKGLICPWCPDRTILYDCPHSVFKLMKQNKDLQDQLYSAEQKLQNYNTLEQLLKEIVNG